MIEVLFILFSTMHGNKYQVIKIAFILLLPKIILHITTLWETVRVLKTVFDTYRLLLLFSLWLILFLPLGGNQNYVSVQM